MADRLDEIRGRLDRHEQYVRRVGGLWRHTLTTDLHWLVDEIDRLRAELGRHDAAHRRDLVRNANSSRYLCDEIERLHAELDQSRTYRITEGVDRG